MKDQELYDLCKQAYEATGWNDTEKRHPYGGVTLPLYTSDYLLEKLPWSTVCSGPNEGMFGTWMNGRTQDTFNEADTPLKALLKLTIALHEEGLIEDINPNGDDTA